MAAFTAEQEQAAAAYPPVKVELPLAPHRKVNDLLGLRTGGRWPGDGGHHRPLASMPAGGGSSAGCSAR